MFDINKLPNANSIAPATPAATPKANLCFPINPSALFFNCTSLVLEPFETTQL